MKIILASASPRRKEILECLGADFEIICADADESCTLDDPCEYAMELAKRKGCAVFGSLPDEKKADAVVISADTVVYAEGEILGKPKSEADATRMIELISGKEHFVISGIAVTTAEGTRADFSKTKVIVEKIPKEEIFSYVRSKDPMDKAGAYGIQGAFSKWVKGIDGCYFNVVGLPANKLNELFHSVTGEYI